MNPELHYLDLTQLSASFRQQQLSPVEVTQALLTRIAALDGKLHSFATLTAELAMAQAKVAEEEIAQGRWRGPLHGVPIAVKDLCYTKDTVTAAGMPIHADFLPAYDATVITRLRQAGAVLLGKLQMTEGAFSGYHPSAIPPVNPWAAERWAGVSSSGSGVATAAGLCFASLGSDTLGSIRFPSAANALTGLKPTWGRVSRYGIFPLAESLDHIGPMTRSAIDAAAVLQVIAGADEHDPTALQASVPDYLAELRRGVSGLRIGVDPHFIASGVDPRVVEALDAAGEVWAKQGATLCKVSVPNTDAAIAATWTLCISETTLAHANTYREHSTQYGPFLTGVFAAGNQVRGNEMAQAIQERERYRGQIAQLFQGIDLLLIPALAGPPPLLSEFPSPLLVSPTPRHRFTSPFNLTGSPTLTLPGGFTNDGVPLAIQLVAGHLQESLLLRAGAAFQSVTDWHQRRPPC